MITFRHACALAAAVALLPAAPALGAFPDTRDDRRPVHAGRCARLIARALAQRLGDALGQPVVVENQPGRGRLVGSESRGEGRPPTATR